MMRNPMNGLVRCLLVGCGLVASTGCQNGIKVVVERLDVENGVSPLPHPSTVELALAYERNVRVSDALAAFIDEYTDLRAAAVDEARADRLGKGPLSEEQRQRLRDAMEKELGVDVEQLQSDARELLLRGRKLRCRAGEYFGATVDDSTCPAPISKDTPSGVASVQSQPVGSGTSGAENKKNDAVGRPSPASTHRARTARIHEFKVDVHVYALDVYSFLQRAGATLRPAWVRNEAKIKAITKKPTEGVAETPAAGRILAPSKLEEALKKVDEATSDLRESRQSFGGFMVTGVFLIDPANPVYKDVLSRATKAQAFAVADTHASGDMSAVIVFDNPVQPRTFQMQNDPTQLIRNVISMIDQAMQAVAKYASIPG